MDHFDYVVVGAGLFGAVFSHEAAKRGKRVLVIDRRSHIGGNCWTRNEDGINIHAYGAHIFRTNRDDIWDYICQFADFNHFINSPIAMYHGKAYNMPFNMNTFNQIWGVTTPAEAKKRIDEQRKEILGEPRNLEEKAISLVGRDVYEILVKEYTEKQWGRPCTELPPSILRRLPVRLTYDNNYFNDRYQGIPIGGYTQIFERMLEGCEVLLNTDFRAWKSSIEALPGHTKVVYTGAIDEYFDYRFGPLEYRSLRFEHERHDETDNLQGNAVFNYCDLSVPYTRTIEHKHFELMCSASSECKASHTVVTREYPYEWKRGIEPYYPINDEKNLSRYRQYAELANAERNVIFGGRLGTYQYTDMQDTIISALGLAKSEF